MNPNDLRELWPGQSQALLKSLHILTPQGTLNQDSRRKLKQVQHLVQLITPHLEGLRSIADLGAGKSYLGLMLYDLYLREREDVELFAIEQRRELVDATKKIAFSSGFTRVKFVASSIVDACASSDLPSEIDAVTALHACDTATDEAIAFALKKNAKFIALVPCCQAEVARLLTNPAGRAVAPLDNLWRHGIHRREFGSLLLESLGYKVRVTELIGWEHSMKNELILASKIQRANPAARRQLDALLEAIPGAGEMKLFNLVGDAGAQS